MTAALSHLYVLIYGTPLLIVFARNSGFRQLSPLFIFALTYLCGELVLVLTLCLSSHFFGAFHWLTPLILLVLSWYGAWKLLPPASEPRPRYSLAEILGPLAFLGLLAAFNYELAFEAPLIAWDARSIWFFHAKAFYFDNAIDLSFLMDPNYLWSHPDYPPLIPLLAAFHAEVFGVWDEVYCKSFMYFHWLASLTCFYFALRSLRVPTIFAAGATIVMQVLFARNALLGYGDSVYGMAWTLGFLFLCTLLQNYSESMAKNRLFVSLCTVFFACAALSKQEGLFFSVMAYGLALALALCKTPKAWRQLTLSFLAFWMLISPWYLYVYIHGISGEYGWTFSSIFSSSLAELIERTAIIGAHGFRIALAAWGPSIFLLYLSALTYSAFRSRKSAYSTGFAGLALIGATMAIYLIYLSTPIDLTWHLNTSFDRLITILGMISVCILAFASREQDVDREVYGQEK